MNLGNYRQAILDELTKASTDTFHSTAILNRFINRAVEFVAKYKPWQQTQYAYKFAPTLTGTETDEYFDYPENFITDSIYRLAVGTGTIASDERYESVDWEEYLNHKEDNSDNKKVYADHKRQYFICPMLTGTPTVSVWGHAVPTALSSDTDTTPFDDDALIEEAIQGYAMSLAYTKMRGSYIKVGQARKAEAIAMLEQAFKQQQRRQAKKKTLDAELWKHTDFITNSAGTRETRRGSFNLDF